MTSTPIVSWFEALKRSAAPYSPSGFHFAVPAKRPDLHTLYEHPERLPTYVRESYPAMRMLELLGPLAWDQFPERDFLHDWDPRPVPYAPFAAACLMKLEQGLTSMGTLRRYLVENPALIWLAGFPCPGSNKFTWVCDLAESLPTVRHLTRMLRSIPNPAFQFLLGSSVTAIHTQLLRAGALQMPLGDTVALDTKHILAWVKQNNPKAYIKEDRFDKTKQPAGDLDCKLGCKRRHNQRPASKEPPATPTANPLPADTVSVGEFYWGYASGIVAVKVPDWGEFILAELTQPFDQPDVSYFFPLMAMAEERLGRKPHFGALDAAFDAFYVYDYFHDAEGLAAIPFSERGGHKNRLFDVEGAPLCEAHYPMALRYTFTSRSGLIEHPCQRYACPLLFPEPSGATCPTNHPQWRKGGCIATLAASAGARLRYTLDRQSETYKLLYKQRTATERLFSQAVDLGIERPHIRNGQAIANLNTLIYTLINLRFLQRIRQRRQFSA